MNRMTPVATRLAEVLEIAAKEWMLQPQVSERARLATIATDRVRDFMSQKFTVAMLRNPESSAMLQDLWEQITGEKTKEGLLDETTP